MIDKTIRWLRPVLLLVTLALLCGICAGTIVARADGAEVDKVEVKFTLLSPAGWELFADEDCQRSLGKVGKAGKIEDPGEAKLEKGSGVTIAYLEPGTYWAQARIVSSDPTTAFQVPVTIPENCETFNVRYTKITASISMSSLKQSIEDVGEKIEDHCLGGTAVLTNKAGEILPWTITKNTTEGKEPYLPVKWYYYVQEKSDRYTVSYTPAEEHFSSWSKFYEGGSSWTANIISIWNWNRTFRIPAEYEDLFHVYQKSGLHYSPFTELVPIEKKTVVEGFVDFTFNLPEQCDVHYTIQHSDELGNIKLSRTRGFNRANSVLWIEQGYSKEWKDYYTIGDSTRWSNYDLDNELRMEFYDSNLYLNVDDSNYLTLQKGETTKLEAFRTWQAVEDVIGNYFIEPDFHYEIIQDQDHPVLSLEEKGEEGRRYVEITAENTGIVAIKVTYDAMYFEGAGTGGHPNYVPGANKPYYDAIEPVNTRVVIVNVGATNTANIQPNIAQTEYDTIYFDDSKTDHAEYTFTPTADEGHTLSVRVHDPLHNTDWDTAWTTYTAAEDGSYTVDLKDGRNIIEISAEDGSVSYYVVNCRALDIDIENLTRPEATDYQLGDTIQIYFDGLTMPVQKMAGIYNPNFPDDGWVEYHTEDGDTVRSAGAQYNAVTRSGSKLTIELTEAGEYRLLNGQIHNTHFGYSLNAHRQIPEEGFGVNLDADKWERSPYFSTLPDITITVRSPEAEAVIALIDAIGEVTLESRDAIEAAEGAYEALSEKEQVLVTNYEDLVAARKAYDKLVEDHAAADTVDALIDAIGTVTLRSGSAIETARTAYDALTNEQKGYVEHYKFLVAAEARYAELKRSAATPEDTTDEPKTSFPDVGGHWAADAIAYAVEKGLMNGTGGGMFSPDANTTRGMIVTILARLEGVDTAKGEVWYEAGRQWAMENGISDGTNMDGQITREQLATMFYRYAQLKGYDTTARTELAAFLDADSVSDWAQDAMQWAVAVGLVQGSDSRLTPAAPATRAQVATILMRLIENVAK